MIGMSFFIVRSYTKLIRIEVGLTRMREYGKLDVFYLTYNPCSLLVKPPVGGFF
ncbi:hypothetical protein VCR3J2_310220 [Vibrio coralliirubri]|nr:hypothetical protein VCR3J2_310220 [Vibrio coralliirubri]